MTIINNNTKSGLVATSRIDNTKFYFYTPYQRDMEEAMYQMGFGNNDYWFEGFVNRPQPHIVLASAMRQLKSKKKPKIQRISIKGVK